MWQQQQHVSLLDAIGHRGGSVTDSQPVFCSSQAPAQLDGCMQPCWPVCVVCTLGAQQGTVMQLAFTLPSHAGLVLTLLGSSVVTIVGSCVCFVPPLAPCCAPTSHDQAARQQHQVECQAGPSSCASSADSCCRSQQEQQVWSREQQQQLQDRRGQQVVLTGLLASGSYEGAHTALQQGVQAGAVAQQR
jgi:hypothetical protein